jgi:hypothetical protein
MNLTLKVPLQRWHYLSNSAVSLKTRLFSTQQLMLAVKKLQKVCYS